MKKVAMKGPIKERRINLSNFFITTAGPFLYVWYMAHGAKINLSAEELQLLSNPDWILTKRRVMYKLADLLGEAAVQLQQVAAANPWLPPMGNTKLNRGENYLGLPYLMLDGPALFSKEGNLAIRTFCWWGHFFSVTLHVSGQYKQHYEYQLITQLQKKSHTSFWLCINTEEWHHHFEPDNYQSLLHMNTASITQTIQQKDFVKIAAQLPLQRWEDAPAWAVDTATKLLALIAP